MNFYGRDASLQNHPGILNMDRTVCQNRQFILQLYIEPDVLAV